MVVLSILSNQRSASSAAQLIPNVKDTPKATQRSITQGKK
jgi:hypothetical protein